MTKLEAFAWFVELYEKLRPGPKVRVGELRIAGLDQGLVTPHHMTDSGEFIHYKLRASEAYEMSKKALAESILS